MNPERRNGEKSQIFNPEHLAFFDDGIGSSPGAIDEPDTVTGSGAEDFKQVFIFVFIQLDQILGCCIFQIFIKKTMHFSIPV